MPSASQIGERLAQARKRKGKTQAEVAEQVGLARTTLVAIEKGERLATDAELLKLASTLSISLNDLLREHAVVAEAAPRFRIGPRRKASDEAKRAFEELVELGRLYVELERIHGISRPAAPLEGVTSYRADRLRASMSMWLIGADAASFLRQQLGYGDGPALEIEPRLELEAGLRLFRMALPARLAGMMIWSDEIGACVAVNRHHPREKQRWSLMHEVGHFLRDRELGDVLPTDAGVSSDPSEQFCDALAKEFLLPAQGVRRRYSEHLRDRANHFSTADLLAMADYFAVSFQAMTLRLEELDLLPSGTYEKFQARGYRPTGARGVKVEPRPRPEDWLPSRYVRLALEAYEKEEVSESELARFLRCDRITARDIYLRRRTQQDEAGPLELDLGQDLQADVVM
jgi:Zn-dependent peptidase ImmA (M78 family)/DNA-binding XRE family transcriptional regulator